MKYIFLDVDGVINTTENRKRLKELNCGYDDWDYNNIFCKDSLNNLKTIISLTGAKIVLQSKRRFSDSLLEPLKFQFMEYGLFGFCIDKTPLIDDDKEKEIKEWLKDRICINFIILDDFGPFFNELKPNLILVDPDTGITEEIKNKAIEMLNKVN